MAARGRPFQAGQSGNPAGRAKGTRTHYSMLAEKLMGGDIEDITRSVIDAAKGGDMTAARIVLDRITPVRRDRPVVFELPAIETTADLPNATNALLQAVASGELTPSEASDIGKAVDAHVRAIELTDVQARLSKLENLGK
jgi:Family of unknown function (DUF5681)